MRPWQVREHRVEVVVRARACRAGLNGLVPSADGPRLGIAVAATPRDRRANEVAREALALGVAPPAVRIGQGATLREKRLRVAGDAAARSDTLERMLA